MVLRMQNTIRLTPSVIDALISATERTSDRPEEQRAWALLTATRRERDGSIVIAPEPPVRQWMRHAAGWVFETMFDEQGNLYSALYSPRRRMADAALAIRLEKLIRALA